MPHHLTTMKKNTSHLMKALQWSLAGLAATFRQEVAFRQEVLMLCVCLPLAFFLGNNGLERAVLIASLLLILITELVNSAVEAAIDRIGPEQHPLSGHAKDVASAAVFLALINATVVWLLVVFG
jgi:diacylglycerol kinase (ATP)